MKRMTVPEEGIETLFGSYDENLKHLESLFNVRIRTQGHELLVDGESPDLERVDRVEVLALVDRLGRDALLAGRGQAALQEMVAQVDERVLRHQVGGGLDVGVG